MIKIYLKLHLYAVFVFPMVFMLWASEVKGDEIEEIVVTAPTRKKKSADSIQAVV